MLITFKNLKESIKTISSGFKHTVARTGLGKVFVWGAGDMGQLGLGSLNHEYLPKQVITEKLTSLKVRVIQAIAGFKSSMILFENGNIFWWGTTCLLKNCANPVALEYLTRLDVIFYELYKKKECFVIDGYRKGENK